MRASKLSVDKTKKDSQRGPAFAKGGKRHMVGPQSAGPDKPGNTGKDQSPAPGARFTRGGGKSKVPDRSLSAKAGRTGVR